MPWGVAAAAIGAAGSIIGGSMSSSSADDSSQVQQNIFNTTQKNLQPYMTAGTGALGNLQSLLGLNGDAGNQWAANAQTQLQNSPGYQFQYNQGQEALDRSAASRGLLLSGAQVKDSQQYGQGFAQNAWNSYLSQFTNLANLGQNSAVNVGQQGVTTGANIGNSMMASGNAMASGITGAASSIASGLGTLAGSGSTYGTGNYGFGGTQTPSWSAPSSSISPYSDSYLGSFSSMGGGSGLQTSMPTLSF